MAETGVAAVLLGSVVRLVVRGVVLGERERSGAFGLPVLGALGLRRLTGSAGARSSCAPESGVAGASAGASGAGKLGKLGALGGRY